ncbi:MAG TPA: hypothetical protein VJ810_14880 [Blastocatellia bacterium]|nr:hypothetical protein [Blastocatellia bacterium]
MRIRNTIPFIVLTLLLFTARAVAADPQIQLTPEKKKALLKFDPVDIVPEVRGNDSQGGDNQGDRGRRRSRQNTGPAVAGVVPAAPTPTPVAQATPSPRATATPTPTPAPASQTKPSPTQSPTQSSVAAARQPEQPGPAAVLSTTTAKPPAHAGRMSLPIIFLLLGVIMVALVAVAAKLKKDLRRS